MTLLPRTLLLIASLAAVASAAPCCSLRKKGSLGSVPSPPPSTPSATVPLNSTTKRTTFPYGSQPVRGVNLGGWLVLEPWITPSIFDNSGNSNIVDEWTLGQYLDYNTALSTLQNHWNSWITESDFQAIAAAGLNHVRIPIGFWAFDNSNTPYIKANQFQLLQQAVWWADQYGISVLVDLHGVPGSQNGYDNSGQRGTASWQNDPDNISRSQAVINTLAQEFSQSKYNGAVTAIELVNEPAGYISSDLLNAAKQYYTDTYPIVRNSGGLVVVLHDAFQDLSYWDGFLTPGTGAWNVLMDTHNYQVFNDAQLEYDWPTHISSACSYSSTLSSYNQGNLWLVVGEWSTASTDCATYLNGRGVGSRYGGTYDGSAAIGSCNGVSGSMSTFSSDYKTFLGQFWEAQVTAYESGANGWIYWCWKNEQADDWSYSQGLAGGWIPQNPSDRQYPNICSSS